MKICVISDTRLKGYDSALEKRAWTCSGDVVLILYAGDQVEEEVLGVFSGKKKTGAIIELRDDPS